MSTSSLDMAALNGTTVTEGHTRICAERGHATHTVDGVDQGTCPRCGNVTKSAAQAKVETLEHMLAEPKAYGLGYGCTYVSLPRLIREARAALQQEVGTA